MGPLCVGDTRFLVVCATRCRRLGGRKVGAVSKGARKTTKKKKKKRKKGRRQGLPLTSWPPQHQSLQPLCVDCLLQDRAGCPIEGRSVVVGPNSFLGRCKHHPCFRVLVFANLNQRKKRHLLLVVYPFFFSFVPFSGCCFYLLSSASCSSPCHTQGPQ